MLHHRSNFVDKINSRKYENFELFLNFLNLKHKVFTILKIRLFYIFFTLSLAIKIFLILKTSFSVARSDRSIWREVRFNKTNRDESSVVKTINKNISIVSQIVSLEWITIEKSSKFMWTIWYSFYMFVCKIYKIWEVVMKIKTDVNRLLLVLTMKKNFRYILIKLNFFSISKPNVVYLCPFLSSLPFLKFWKLNFMYFSH